MTVFFQKIIRLDSGGLSLLKSNILLSESPEPVTGAQEPFKWKWTLQDVFFLEFEKIIRTN